MPREDRAAPPAGSWIGTQLAKRYRLVELLGHGSFGEVFRAEDCLTHRQVAVKLLFPRNGRPSPHVRRELATLRALRLPGVVQLLEDGVAGERAYIVMSLVDGHPFPAPPTVLALLESNEHFTVELAQLRGLASGALMARLCAGKPWAWRRHTDSLGVAGNRASARLPNSFRQPRRPELTGSGRPAGSS